MKTLRCHLVNIEVELVGLFADSFYFTSDEAYDLCSGSFTVERDSDNFFIFLFNRRVNEVSFSQSCQFRDNQDDILVGGAINFSEVLVIEP